MRKVSRMGCPGKCARFLVLAAALFHLLGCANAKPSPLEGGGDPIFSPSISPFDQIFPHSEGWESPASHGGFAVQNGTALCLNCHSAEAGRDDSPPPCSSCHALYPHEGRWAEREGHGAWVRANGDAPCATRCHGEDLSGGLTRIACDSCHNIYPHRGGWLDPEGHGQWATGSGNLLCAGCHGGDFRGGTSGVACYSCHAVYPHRRDWTDPSAHGLFVKSRGIGLCATKCHGADLGGGLSGVSCNLCHSIYPHAAGWGEPDGHGAAVLAEGKGVCATQCHGADFGGGLSGVACGSCHSLYPHREGWVDGHGAEALRLGFDSCRACHGEDLKRLLGGKNCDSCHQGYPHDPTTWLAAHGPQAWGDGKESCAKARCHGEDYEGSAGAPSCSDPACHVGYPHLDEGWTAWGRASVHANTFIGMMEAGEINACQTCHGAKYDRETGEDGEGRCTRCHRGGVTHRTAVVTDQEVPWSAGSQHGKTFSTYIGFRSYSGYAFCWDCHDHPVGFDDAQTKDDLKAASDCYGCHFSYPHLSYSSAQLGFAPWVPQKNQPLGHVYYLLDSPLATDAQGNLLDTADPVPAIAHTCGGTTSNLCHFNGRRSSQIVMGSKLCGGYCHTM